MSVFAGRFAGRTAIVTGGASGLGLAVAERIVAEGGAVSLWDMSDALDAVCERLGAHGVRVDVSDEDAVDAAATASEAALGRVDILVCSAGITGPTVPVHDFGFEGVAAHAVDQPRRRVPVQPRGRAADAGGRIRPDR